MTQKFYAIVTNLGAAKIANAVSLGTKLNITQMAVGDGGGTLPTPNASQTKLVNEVRRAALNSLTVDENNSSQIIAEQVIPETEGGFWIREMGLFDADGTLIAVRNTAETSKPQLQEGSGRTQRLRMMIIVSSIDAVTLRVDPAVVLATRQYVDNAVIEVKAYADGVMENHVKSANPHAQYPLISNALKELADAGLLPDVLKNLGLGDIAKAGVATGVMAWPGYAILPLIINGAKVNLILQWGVTPVTAVPGSVTGTYPITFPNSVLFIGLSENSNTAQAVAAWGVGPKNTTNFTAYVQAAGGPSTSEQVNFFAIGF